MANIDEMAMGDYKKCIRDDVGPRLVHPTIPTNATFELKGHIFTALKDIPFYGKDHEDASKHLDEVNDIADYFNTPNIPRETTWLRMLLVTFKGAAKDWLKALPFGTITTWAQLREKFLDQFCLPSKISKLKKAIANFEQNPGESLYEAWERYKGLLRNFPQHDLNIQQEMSIFYDVLNVMTRKLLDSQGPLTKKNPNKARELIEEFSKHSREYHNPGRDGIKGSGGARTKKMVVVMAMLNTMDRRLTQMDQSIHAIRVGCERFTGPHLTKDCHLDEYGNKRLKFATRVGKSMMKIEENQRKSGSHMKSTRSKKRRNLSRQAEASTKKSSHHPRRNAKGTPEYDEGTAQNDDGLASFVKKSSSALEEEPQQFDPEPKKPKLENENVAKIQKPHRGTYLSTSWPLSEQKISETVSAYRPPLPFPSQANLSPLEREHLEFIQKIKGISINTPFINSLAKVPEYTKFLQDLIDTQHELKKNSKVILSEQSSRAVLGEIPKKMGDPKCLTLPREFGNNLKTYALANSGASINLMPYTFYEKLNIQKMKATKMTIHMANRSVTHPRGIVEDILVKIRKFVFLVDFVIMDTNVLIILGWPLLNIVGALVGVRESKLTLRVGDDKEDFGMQDGFQGYDVKGEVLNVDEDNELEELEKLMEGEIMTLNQVKRTKPRASVPFLIEVIAYTTPTSLLSEESDEMSSDEEDVTSRVTSPVVKKEKDTTELKMMKD
ncbi:uncharacterized protein LOC111911152 [Lactuca sativa]|uniref:uncharacterized protein LOC111911152 n=1 Tax=Lactuca sativa TaxID=4236 RepID=UPI000CD9A77E|nr:uncharacterized protein LOC111911152 [Lactuca sativa]